MNVAVTATRYGATDLQLKAVTRLLTRLAPDFFFHGMCAGGDTQVALIADALCHRPVIVGLPGPPSPWHNPQAVADRVRPAKAHLSRNKDIVDALGPQGVLLALPREWEPQPRGGTWWTVRFCAKKGITVYVIRPDGIVDVGLPAEETVP